MDNPDDLQKIESPSFEGFFSLDTWKEILGIVKDYFLNNEKFIRFIGFSVAISGLFMSLGDTDPSMKKIQAFFFAITILLICVFILKSLILLYQNKHGVFYNNIVLALTYIGVILIFNFGIFLVHNFKQELLYYLYWIGVPIIGLGIHFSFNLYFRLISKIKKIKGTQLRTFFFITLDLYLSITWALSGNVLNAFHRITQPHTIYFFIVLLILETISDLFPFTSWKTKREIIIDLALFVCIALLGITFFISEFKQWHYIAVLFSK